MMGFGHALVLLLWTAAIAVGCGGRATVDRTAETAACEGLADAPVEWLSLRTGQNYRDVAKRLERHCECGDARACGELAFGYGTARGVPYDETRELALAKRSCRAGYGPSCAMQGALENGGLTVWSYSGPLADRAHSLSEPLCEQGDHRACVTVFRIEFARGNMARVGALMKTLDRDCQAGYDSACYDHARMGRLMRKKYFELTCGEDPAGWPDCPNKDPALSKRFREATERGDELEKIRCGRAPTPDCGGPALRQAAVELCRAGDHYACDDAARIPRNGAPAAEARALFERACAGKIAHACTAAAEIYRDGDTAVPPKRTRARELFEKACSLSDKYACRRAADSELGAGCLSLPLVETNHRHGNVPFRFVGFTGRGGSSTDEPVPAGARSKLLVLYVTAPFDRLYNEDLATIDAVSSRFGGDLVEFVVLQSGTDESAAPVLRYTKLLFDPTTSDENIGPQSRLLGTKYIPETYFVDRTGTVVHYAQGTRSLHRGHLERCVRSLLAN